MIRRGWRFVRRRTLGHADTCITAQPQLTRLVLPPGFLRRQTGSSCRGQRGAPWPLARGLLFVSVCVPSREVGEGVRGRRSG